MKVFISHSTKDARIAEGITDILSKDRHNVFLPMDLSPGQDWYTALLSALRSADVVLAVVGRDSPDRLFYELGMASGLGLPMLVVSASDEQMPQPLMNIPYVQLSGNDAYDSPRILRALQELKPIDRTSKAEYKSAEAALRAAAADSSLLETMNGVEFERLVAGLFAERGYSVKSKSARDTGVDFSIELPDGKATCAVEVKKMSQNSRISVEAVRSLASALELTGAGIGLLISTVAFTASALALAEKTRVRLRTLNDVLSAKSAKELFSEEHSSAR